MKNEKPLTTKSTAWDTLKEALSLASNVFTIITVAGLAFAFFQGNLDISHQTIFTNLMTVFVCIFAIVLYKKLQARPWLGILLLYVAMMALLTGFTWLSGILFDFQPDYLGNLLVQTGLFIIIGVISAIGEYFKRRNRHGQEDSERD